MMADAPVVGQLAKVLDNLQICAPRAAQIALAWAIDALGDWRERNRTEIVARGDAFRAMLDTLPGWRIDSQGAYFAYVRHGVTGAAAAAVAESLARGRGVLCLPGSYFGPGQDRHLRVAIANVDSATIASLGRRFANLTGTV
jgi:hypothetical protein